MEVNQILETIRMVEEENLDIRTITMGISLLDCMDEDVERACDKIFHLCYANRHYRCSK